MLGSESWGEYERVNFSSVGELGLDYRRAVDGKHMSEPDFEIQVQEPPSINFADTQHVAGCFFPPECRTTARLHGARAYGYEGVCGVGPSVPSKKQCVRESTLVPCRVEGSHVATNVVGPSVVRQLDKSACLVMATTSKTNSTHEEKGKMIMTEPEITAIADLGFTHCNKTIEAVVYRKWTSRHVYTRQPIKYCCILIDKQANMDVKDAEQPITPATQSL
ncbi:hypothetical protein Tco_1182085 [Tanacetum coccineum]